MSNRKFSTNSEIKWDEYKDWRDQRIALDDWAEYISNKTGKLNRLALSKELGWGSQVPYSNTRIKDDLKLRDDELVEKGVSFEKSSSGLKHEAKTSDQRVNRAQQKVNALEEQVASLKAELSTARATIKKYGLLETHLNETGRLIRGFK